MIKLSWGLALLLFTNILNADHHKIQILLTNPRSVSTAFERSMMARGDHKVLHEPWVSSYMYHTGEEVFNQPPPQEVIDAKNYEEVKALIYGYAAHGPVFVKDMVWCMAEELFNDNALLSDPNVVLTILIRDPALSIESSFSKIKETLPSENIYETIPLLYRYDVLVRIAEKYHEIRGELPIIIEAEDLCCNPQATMQSFCKQAGISFLEEALFWEEGMPEEWKHLSSWHTDAAQSKGFFVPERDKQKSRFSMIPDEYASFFESFYQEQYPFYEILKQIKQ